MLQGFEINLGTVSCVIFMMQVHILKQLIGLFEVDTGELLEEVLFEGRISEGIVVLNQMVLAVRGCFVQNICLHY